MRSIKVEISKLFYFPLFCISCLGMVGICLFSECYMDGTGRAYTVIEMIFQRGNINLLDDISLNSLEVWKRGLGTWAYLLLPLLLSISYLFVLSTERHSGAVRQIIFREGRFHYCLSKLVSAVIYSGFLALIGYMIYGLIVLKCFPPLYAYPDGEISSYMEYYLPNGVIPFVVKRLAGVALYGIYMNAYGIGVSLVFADPYILLCLPMMLSYIYSQIISKISIDAFNQNKIHLAEKIQLLRMENVIEIGEGVSWFCGLFLLMITYVILFAMFFFILKKRSDCGEWT